MLISWKLRGVLMDHGLDKRGVLLRMSDDTGIHRTTISNMYHDRAPNVSLETLGKLCQWLRQHGVKDSVLPGGLLTNRPAALFQALAARGAVTMILGEYLPVEKSKPPFRWVARRDAHAAAKLIEVVSDSSQVGGTSPRVQMSYVPFHKVYGRRVPQNRQFHKDVENASQICQNMRQALRHSSAVLIGSPHINYAVEHYVAELFNCKPFVRTPGGAQVPFYRVYRDYEADLPSCCGGRTHPEDGRSPAKPGIYYRDDSNRWSLLPWTEQADDAAVIITTFDSRTDEFVLVILGYAGRATANAGSWIAEHPDWFWRTPTKDDPQPLTIIYICRVGFGAPADDQPADAPARSFETVHRIDPLRVAPQPARSL
jgi:DNA-binding Xre family transcriptional regulator